VLSLRPILFASLISAAVLGCASTAEAKTIRVKGDAQFAKAEKALRRSGGTIVLRPALYRKVVLGPRSRRPLRVVGMPGVRVQSVIFDRTQRVSFGRVRIGPITRNALVQIRRSRRIELHHLVVSARGTRFSASVLVPNSRHVTIRDSNFQHCGDRVRRFVNCVTFYRWSHDLLLERNRFHDCYGCDFVHGRFGTRLTLRGNSFERALPCSFGRYRCGHQDLVQLFSGRRLLVADNHFGVYREGGAQLYLTNDVDHATVVNNVFVGWDRRVPGYRARMGIVVGANRSRRLPHHARILNNTILTGWRRRDGYSGSIRMSSRYGSVPRWKRPIVVNNVIALLEQPARVCNASQRFLNNVVVRGRTCSDVNHLGSAGVDGWGRPRPGSVVIDGANRALAPATDATGRRRRGAPDIGALEYRGA
jgi:hypothetical protein